MYIHIQAFTSPRSSWARIHKNCVDRFRSLASFLMIFTMASPLMTLTCILLAVASVVVGEDAQIVQTTLGSIQGLRRTVKGESIGRNGDVKVDEYYGIPFAKPPVKELRFKHPEPAERWSGVKKTVTKPNSCVQSLDTQFGRFPGVEMWNPNTQMSEDCLYLNVWVPRGFGSQPPKATMVWIFGGGFWSGTSTLDVYNGANLAATENVIVVSLNYRLGALGFLYSESDKDKAPGNQGLMDQVMALKWVHDNVANFGGQKETITIFGESAGAVSVGFHLMSPLSMNYFSRAIMQSASPVAHWAVRSKSQADYRTQRLSDMVCRASKSKSRARPTSRSSLSCLLEADPQEITDAMWNLTSYYFEVPFAPIVDEYFLPEHPKDLMQKGKVKDTEIILGVNKDEGVFWLLYGFPEQFPYNNSGNMSEADLQYVVHRLNFKGEEKRDKAIIYQYVESLHPKNRVSYRDVADDISGDDLFKCPVVNFASEYAALGHKNKVFVYSFEHRLSNNPWPAWTGVMHGYEIEAMFALPNDYNYTDRERKLASRVTSYWTRFAQFGDPNGVEPTKDWPQMTTKGLEYLKITDQGDTVQGGMRHAACSFRNTVLPLLEEGTLALPPPTPAAFTLPQLTPAPPSICSPLAAVSAAI